MKKTLALLLTALPLLCGCEYDFPLKSVGDEDRLTVVAAVNEDGTMFVDVETTVPINKYADGDKADTSLTKLELSVNGRPCALVRQDSLYKESSLSGNRFWKSVEPIRPGDEVEIAAKGVSTKEVSSSFTMPSAPVISSIESGVHVSELSDLADYGLFDVRVKSQYFKVRIADVPGIVRETVFVGKHVGAPFDGVPDHFIVKMLPVEGSACIAFQRVSLG